MKVLITLTDDTNVVSPKTPFEWSYIFRPAKGELISNQLLTGLPIKEELKYWVSYISWETYEDKITPIINLRGI